MRQPLSALGGAPADVWKIPETRPIGDKTPSAIYSVIGHALSTWEAIESSFATIFGTFLRARITNAAERAYGSIISASGRRDALNAASEMFFLHEKVSQNFRENYGMLMQHFQRAVGRRNDIAHGMVSKIMRETEDLGYYLIPAPYNTNKNENFFAAIEKGLPANFTVTMLHSYSYTAADIQGIDVKLQILLDVVQTYWSELSSAYPMKF